MAKPPLYARIENATYAGQEEILRELVAMADLDGEARARISAHAAALVRDIRSTASPGLMEVFLAEYGLSTDEGVALMCLAEALLRVPDAGTIDALIEDKIAPSGWGLHLGRSSSPLVNASTWGLMLTGKVLEDTGPGLAGLLHAMVKRLGEPVIRTAVGQAMREMGRQFVLGEDIDRAMKRARRQEARGYSYSYDMLGEAARTGADARRYLQAYSSAITAISANCQAGGPRLNPGISVKLSALFPRFEVSQHHRVMNELVPRVRTLAHLARKHDISFNIDAEEAGRLVLSLDVIEAVLSDPGLAGWDGFGVAVQSYGQRAGPVIDWLHDLATRLDRKIMVRLVKGAYWDSEIKHAQIIGAKGFPVFTQKAASDIAFIANARRLLAMTDRIYPQFATHNAHSAAAILDMAEDPRSYEFQRLHGMGESLFDRVLKDNPVRCRIYAPVGAHRDLLAYLVRRLLENGANSSFVNQITDSSIAAETVAADPFGALAGHPAIIRYPAELFLPERRNSRGWDLDHRPDLERIEAARNAHITRNFTAAPEMVDRPGNRKVRPVRNPANPEKTVGQAVWASAADIDRAVGAARTWDVDGAGRAAILNRVAGLYEANFGEFYALLAREAGKTLPDAVSELREAVDFIRYYAANIPSQEAPPAGLFACISPWNFPLAIFTGQIAAALAAGNAALAKPAEQTPLIAAQAVRLFHEAGVPRHALALLPGDGGAGAMLTSDARVNGVVFTGSVQTARMIRKAMARHLAPGAPLIAETGGLNAMIVDSTALLEQAVQAVMESAFQSAGQRCSALRCLYVQQDIAAEFCTMLYGAMDELTMADPWDVATDVGPVIDTQARDEIAAYITRMHEQGRVLKQLPGVDGGYFVPPCVIRVDGIADLEGEVFGPVLHLAVFRAGELDKVISDINKTGYGLTFGLHSRIDDRVQQVVERLKAGNIYINRNQIGAVVGSQPFGGEGLSGTGPKAGGPHYLSRFVKRQQPPRIFSDDEGPAADARTVQKDIDDCPPGPERLSCASLPGPTGESNQLSTYCRPPLLCLGPGARAVEEQMRQVRTLGGRAVAANRLPPGAFELLTGFSAAIFWGGSDMARQYDQALADGAGPLHPLITGMPVLADVQIERHCCINTTASGGNARLLSEVGRNA